MTEQDYIIDQIVLYQNQLKDVISNGIKSLEFDVDCSLLSYQKHRENDITKSDEYREEIFEKLENYIGNPCIYWFDFDREMEGAEIFRQIELIKGYRNVPAHNKRPHNGTCLYVGKATKNIHGRLMMHLGVHKNEKSHGLNLLYWEEAFRKNLKLKFHVLVFPETEEWGNMIYLMEFILSEKKKPIIGKHTR